MDTFQQHVAKKTTGTFMKKKTAINCKDLTEFSHWHEEEHYKQLQR